MDSALQHELQTSIRKLVTATFDADSTGVLDAGKGRSFVGFFIKTALVANTTLTFKGDTDDDTDTAPAEASLALVRVENADGSAVASYTIEVVNNLGYFPLRSTEFNGLRFLQALSDEDNTDKTAIFVSKAKAA